MDSGKVALFVVLLLVSHPSAVRAHPSSAERIAFLDREVEARPEDPRPYLERGAEYSHDGQYELALADLRKAEELGDPIVAAYELGLLHHRMGRLAVARTYLDAFLARSPNDALALEERARLLGELGQVDAAVADYERLFAVSRHPNPGSYVAAARLLAAQGEGGIAPALAMLDRGMERLGVVPQLQQPALELELLRGREAQALDRLRSLEPALGESPDWKVEMAELLLRTERAGEARAFLASASAQLATLRQTPARRALATRVAALEREATAAAPLAETSP